MEKASVEEIESWMGPASTKRPLSRALGMEHVNVNYFELEEGETFGFGYHRHPEQEEMFYLIEGTATFETEDGDVEVREGETIRFAPGEWQLGRNDGDDRVVALALGAPADASDADIRKECENCGERTPASIERADDEDALVTLCEQCGSETGRYT